jgi:ubiquinone/menaquinone biosynthesis C-methylase UbiE
MTANEFYTHGHSPAVTSSHARRTASDSAAFMVSRLDRGSILLDFGCGPGSITVDLAHRLGPSGMAIGLDASGDVLNVASRDSAAPNVSYVQGSVYHLPFSDGTFDVAYGHQVLQHLGDPVAALREVLRVLRRGGVVAVRDADYGSMTHHPHYPDLDEWKQIYRQVARHNGGEPDAGRRLQEWVAAAGYVEVEASASAWHYTTREARRTWAGLWAERIQVPRFADRAIALDAHVDVARLATAWLDWAEEPDGWFAFLHGEVTAVTP